MARSKKRFVKKINKKTKKIRNKTKKKQYGGECNPIHEDRNYDDLFTYENIYESHFIPEMRIMLRGRCYLITSLYDYHITQNNERLATRQEPNITELELGEIKNKYTIGKNDKLFVEYANIMAI